MSLFRVKFKYNHKRMAYVMSVRCGCGGFRRVVSNRYQRDQPTLLDQVRLEGWTVDTAPSGRPLAIYCPICTATQTRTAEVTASCPPIAMTRV